MLLTPGSIIFSILFQAIQVGAGGINVGAVIVVTIGTDVFRQATQVSLTMSALRYARHFRPSDKNDLLT